MTYANANGTLASFGIGTSLTNDFHSVSSGGKEKSRALNMVIKLAGVDGKHTVKISDELTKVGPSFLSYQISELTGCRAEYRRRGNRQDGEAYIQHRRVTVTVDNKTPQTVSLDPEDEKYPRPDFSQHRVIRLPGPVG